MLFIFIEMNVLGCVSKSQKYNQKHLTISAPPERRGVLPTDKSCDAPARDRLLCVMDNIRIEN